jgi:hypothetical protein
VEDSRLGSAGSLMWKVDTSKVVTPACVSSGQWVDPHEQVLTVLITC